MPEFLIWSEVVIPIAGMVTGIVITLSVLRLVSRQFDRRHAAQAAPAVADEALALRAEVQDLRAHVEAIEERLDFTERLLTKERGREPLGPG